MAKGAAYAPKPPAKGQKSLKSTEPVNRPGQSRSQDTDESQHGRGDPYARLLNAERERRDKFGCYNCMTLKYMFEFEPDQTIQVRRMDMPWCPIESLRRVCVDCGISIGLYRPGHVVARTQSSSCWVCDCPRAHEKDEDPAGSEQPRCNDCGMTQPFSSPASAQNHLTDIVSIFPLRRNRRFATARGINAPSAEPVRKTSIPFLLCSTSAPVSLTPPYQYVEMASEPDEGTWSSEQ
ncbi:hypothetical protein PG990_012938 [Apiospora arundinis]